MAPEILTEDIERRLASDFVDAQDRAHVRQQLLSLWTVSLNVGPEQLARCMLVRAAGDRSEINRAFETKWDGDPRDYILAAMGVDALCAHGLRRFPV